MADDKPEDKWQVERKIPLAFILALLVQTIIITVFIIRLEGRLNILESKDVQDTLLMNQRMKLADERYDTLVRDREKAGTAVARVEEQIKGVYDSLKRIEIKLDTPVMPTVSARRGRPVARDQGE